jgi:ADP-dependent NAD(P)H-hydrate dehydratase / NAD(P)H-hydrate epimerase
VKIYNTRQIKEWDNFTIANEPIKSIDLMERAAQRCAQWILAQNWLNKTFKIICGKGNNGGDGLAIARMLSENGYKTEIYILEFGRLGTDDFQINLQRLHQSYKGIYFIQSPQMFPQISTEDIVIDALFGSGLNKPLEGITVELVNHINKSGATIISIDAPSGLYIDHSSTGNTSIKANITLTFQTMKLAYLMAENLQYTGIVQVLDIGLAPNFSEESNFEIVELPLIRKIYKPRPEFAHKGTFGHSLVIGGSYGKIGAVVLCSRAALRSGAGLVSVLSPACGYNIIQTAVPEAMTITGDQKYLAGFQALDFEKYDVIGIGPGLGTEEETQQAVKNLVFNYNKPLVIDADALNCLALHKDLLNNLPPYTIITPHPKEFERLFGKGASDFERADLAITKARELKIIIILKGHYSLIAMPDGTSYFNSTGNPGLATGGTGDVLTGILTSLVGQKYHPTEAALLGVYIHGLAGDIAAENNSMEALIAGDLISNLGSAFKRLQ